MKKLIYFCLIGTVLASCGSAGAGKKDDKKAAGDTIAARNMKAIQDMHAAMEKGDMEACAKFYAADFKAHAFYYENNGIGTAEEMKETGMMWMAGFPDFKVDIINISAGGEWVYVQYHGKGTNSAELFGMPPTNKTIDYNGVDAYKFNKEGKITDYYDYGDNYTVGLQLGWIPDMQDTTAAM